jgi:hypothetical protein
METHNWNPPRTRPLCKFYNSVIRLNVKRRFGSMSVHEDVSVDCNHLRRPMMRSVR